MRTREQIDESRARSKLADSKSVRHALEYLIQRDIDMAREIDRIVQAVKANDTEEILNGCQDLKKLLDE